MSVVKINAITVPKERADELVGRFAARAGEVSKSPGFEAFELLQPTDDRDTFLVYTRWASEDDFQNWMNERRVPARPPGAQHAGPGQHAQRPVAVRRGAARGSARLLARFSLTAPVSTLLDFHKVWGYIAIGLERARGRDRAASRGAGRPRAWQVRVDRHDRRRGGDDAAGARRARSWWRARTTWRRASTCSTGSSRSSPSGIAYQYRRQMRGRRRCSTGWSACS